MARLRSLETGCLPAVEVGPYLLLTFFVSENDGFHSFLFHSYEFAFPVLYERVGGRRQAALRVSSGSSSVFAIFRLTCVLSVQHNY